MKQLNRRRDQVSSSVRLQYHSWSIETISSLILIGVFFWPIAVMAEQARTFVEWRFGSPGEMHGWVANRDWKDAGIRDGHWAAEISGRDPVLLGPVLEPPLTATDSDYVEIRFRLSRDGIIQFFFTQTLQGKYGGFFRDRSILRRVPATGEFVQLRLWPCWGRYKKILRLRLDGPETGGTLELESIAVRRATGPQKPETEWDLRDADTAARFSSSTFRARTEPSARGLKTTGTHGPPEVALDRVLVPAEKHPWLVVRMSASAGPYGGFFFHSPSRLGNWYTFPIRADGRMHQYNVWLGDYDLVDGPKPFRPKRSRFRGLVREFSLFPTYEPEENGVVESISFRSAPSGPPLPVIEYFGAAEALLRAGCPGQVALRVRNAGGAPARDLRVKLHAAEGLSVAEESLRGVPGSIPPDQAATLYMEAVAGKGGRYKVKVNLECEKGTGAAASSILRFEPPLPELEQGVIPEPRPLKTAYDIGVYYFPGWWGLYHWPTIPPYAERRPLLGFYDEASPVVADWDIKWAVEHGIDHFVVEWWWNRGKIWGENFIEKALLKSRFLPFIKFCVMWNNPQHFEPWSEADFVALTDYWIQHYFPNPSYKKLSDGRPVAYMLQGFNFLDDFGKEGAKRLLAGADARAREAGFPGIYWVVGAPRGKPGTYAEVGFEATTLYNFAGRGCNGYPTSPAWQHVDLARSVWDKVPRNLKPVLPISTGFDHRPWFGRTPNNCRYGFTPALFERHLRDAKAYLDARGERSLVIEAWNEWGEGSCLGPMAQFGFELLEAVPRVFAPDQAARPLVGPADVGVYAPEIPGLWQAVHRPAFYQSMKEKQSHE